MERNYVLTKAMAIAKRNGFDLSEDFFTETPTDIWLMEGQDLYYSLIFCHDFARAFFGEENIKLGVNSKVKVADLSDVISPILFLKKETVKIPYWQYHLMQMSVNKDPLSYIEEYLEQHEKI